MNRDEELSSNECEFRALPRCASVRGFSEVSKRPMRGSSMLRRYSVEAKAQVWESVGLDSNPDAGYLH